MWMINRPSKMRLNPFPGRKAKVRRGANPGRCLALCLGSSAVRLFLDLVCAISRGHIQPRANHHPICFGLSLTSTFVAFPSKVWGGQSPRALVLVLRSCSRRGSRHCRVDCQICLWPTMSKGARCGRISMGSIPRFLSCLFVKPSS